MAAPNALNIMEAFAARNKDRPPPHSDLRFDASGNFLPAPGNTIVCHVVEGSRTQQSLIAFREALMALPFADHFTFTPVASLLNLRRRGSSKRLPRQLESSNG